MVVIIFVIKLFFILIYFGDTCRYLFKRFVQFIAIFAGAIFVISKIIMFLF